MNQSMKIGHTHTTRHFLLLMCLFIVTHTTAQSKIKGLFSNQYGESRQRQDLLQVDKPVYFIYNDFYCQLFIDNQVYHLKNLSYLKKITPKGVVEIITTAEDDHFNSGWFEITVTHFFDQKNEMKINIPFDKNGHFYYVPNASIFSKKNELDYQQNIQDWVTFQKADSIKLQPSNVRDSIQLNSEELKKIKDSIIAIAMDQQLSKGDNINLQQIRWLSDSVSSKIKLSKGEEFYKNFKLLIDKKGVVTKVISLSEPDSMLEKYFPAINNILLGTQLMPYVALNGKIYPSYKTLYIRLYP